MGFFVCYNEIMKKFKSSSKNNSSKKNVQIKNDKNSKVILEDKHLHKDNGAILKIINDKNAPFYQYKYTEFNKWKEGQN